MYRFILLLVCTNCLIGCGAVQSQPTVVATRDIGIIPSPANTCRDRGASGIIGGKVLWTFGDTLFRFKAVDGMNYRSNTAAWAEIGKPLELSEPLDANGAPFLFIPFTREEQTYNDASGKPDDRIALFPGNPITTGETSGIVLFSKIKIGAGVVNYQHLGTGFAYVAAGGTTAKRQAELLFTENEPMLIWALSQGNEVYLYGNRALGSVDSSLCVVVANVTKDQFTNRSAYRFWDGINWVSEVQQAATLFDGVPGDMSVSYNAYLQQFIAVYAEPFTDNILLRTAPRPEGPWSKAQIIFTGEKPGEGLWNYGALEHPELSINNGKTIVVTYYYAKAQLDGEIRAVEISFK